MRFSDAICEVIRVLSDGTGMYDMVYTIIYLILNLLCLVSVASSSDVAGLQCYRKRG